MVNIFLDTADIDCLKHWKDTGCINGITTNPSNLSKIDRDPREVVREIVSLYPEHDVSIQVIEQSPTKLYEQAHEIASLGKNVVVKIPCVQDYFPIIQKLIQEKIRINVTLVFSSMQAVVMANFGATYISPFIGRLEDNNQDGIKLIKQIRAIFNIHKYETKILAASLRTMHHVQESILAGADIVTLPPLLCQHMFQHPLTDQGLLQFSCDWQKTNNTSFPN